MANVKVTALHKHFGPVHAVRGIDLAHIEGVEFDPGRQLTIDTLAGSAQLHWSVAQNHVGPAGAAAWDRRQVENEAIGNRQGIKMFEQMAPTDQTTLGLSPHQKLDPLRPAREGCVGVALAISDHRDRHRARGAQGRGCLCADQPTPGLLGVGLARRLARGRLVPFPNLHVEEA